MAGGAFETATSQAGTVQRRLYVAGAAIVIDTVGLPAPAETRYLLRDHLGSLDVVLDSTGVVLERLSFDAWGKRRKVDWTAYLAAEPGYVWQSTPITRGYTGHEQLDPVGLVHMNGRVYDPEIGRFLSADIVIQDVTNLQSLNAYSYVLNNPLSFTDPSGFFFKSLFRAVFRAIGGVLRAVVRSSIGRAIIHIVACANPVAIYTCGAAAAGLALAAGGSIVDAVKAAAFSFIQMGVWTGVGSYLSPILSSLAETSIAAATAVKGAVHGVVGGALSVAQGGSFLQGFASNAIGGAAGYLSSHPGALGGIGGGEGIALRTAIAATAGGLAAEVTGGKFANGAITGAFAQMYNAEGGRLVGAWIGGFAGGAAGAGSGPFDAIFIAGGRYLGAAVGSAIEDLVLAEQVPPPKIEGFTDHGWERMQEDQLKSADLNDALNNPLQKIPQDHGTTQYVGRTATVVLNENNWVVTVWRTGTFR